MKRILITGQNSYIGNKFENAISDYADKYHVSKISVRDSFWEGEDFSGYDVIVHVAAIVHKKEKPELRKLYNQVNRDLPVAIAKKAKYSGVKQFIFISTMAVYGEEGKINKKLEITSDTMVNPKTYYALSKLEAELTLGKLNDERFKVAIIRPPMVYGPNCPGNFAKLERLALKLPVFPMVTNERSMIQIDLLCSFIKKYIDNEERGIFFPQDYQYVNTSLLVKEIAELNGRKIVLSKFLGVIIRLIGEKVTVLKKLFGNLVYEKSNLNKE